MKALALAAVLAAAGSAPGQPPRVFRAEIGMVVLQATVRNAERHPVTGLDAGAFTVYENGTAQSITLFRQGEVPVSLGLLLDNSRSMRERRGAVEAAALAELRGSSPQDEAFVMNFADRAEVNVPLTRDPGALAAGAHRQDATGGTALRDAVAAAAEYLSRHAAHPRRALIVISDGNDNASTLEPEALDRQMEQSEVAVYTIGLLDPDDAARAGRGRQTLERLAAASGGATSYPATAADLERAALELAHQIRHVYTLGYAPLAQALDGSYRKLRVVAKGSQKLRVSTRRGYRATAPSR